MKLGDLLVAAKLVSPQHVADALAQQLTSGKRLGEILVTSGALTQTALDGFLFVLFPQSVHQGPFRSSHFQR